MGASFRASSRHSSGGWPPKTRSSASRVTRGVRVGMGRGSAFPLLRERARVRALRVDGPGNCGTSGVGELSGNWSSGRGCASRCAGEGGPVGRSGVPAPLARWREEGLGVRVGAGPAARPLSGARRVCYAGRVSPHPGGGNTHETLPVRNERRPGRAAPRRGGRRRRRGTDRRLGRCGLPCRPRRAWRRSSTGSRDCAAHSSASPRRAHRTRTARSASARRCPGPARCSAASATTGSTPSGNPAPSTCS